MPNKVAKFATFVSLTARDDARLRPAPRKGVENVAKLQ